MISMSATRQLSLPLRVGIRALGLTVVLIAILWLQSQLSSLAGRGPEATTTEAP